MRKSISTAFFSMVSTLMVLGIVLMGCSEWVLFKNYFAKDRYETLDQVVNVAKRTAEYLVNSETMPQGAELDALNTKLEIIGESAEAYLFFTDRQGNVLIASDPAKLTTDTVPLDICQRANAVADPDARHYHAFSDLGGALTEKSYIAAVETIDDQSLFSGWLFLCSSGAQLTDFKQQFWSNFLMSACVMLLCASVLTRLLMRQLTDPLQKSPMPPSALAAATSPSAWRAWRAMARWQTLPAPSTRWQRTSSPTITPEVSSWATSPTSCAPP